MTTRLKSPHAYSPRCQFHTRALDQTDKEGCSIGAARLQQDDSIFAPSRSRSPTGDFKLLASSHDSSIKTARIKWELSLALAHMDKRWILIELSWEMASIMPVGRAGVREQKLILPVARNAEPDRGSYMKEDSE